MRLGSGGRRAALLVVPVLAVLGALLLFGSGGGDDSHITWWVVDELTRTGKIVNLNGDALEQSSSLGLVLLAAAVGLLLPVATAQLGVLALAAGARWDVLAERALGAPASTRSWSFPHACSWRPAARSFIGGRAAWKLRWRRLHRFGYSMPSPACSKCPAPASGASCLTWRLGGNVFFASAWFVSVRPENPLLLGAVLASTGLLSAERGPARAPERGRSELPTLIGAAVIAVAPAIALFLFRRSTFHEWFPHPVSAKAGGGTRWGAGLHYLLEHTWQFQPALLLLLPLSALLLIALSISGLRKPLPALLAAHGSFGVLFVLSSGGDWMSCGRFWPLLLPVWWLIVLGAAHYFTRDRHAWLLAGALTMAVANLTFLVRLAHGGGTNGYPLAAALKVVPVARARIRPLELPIPRARQQEPLARRDFG